MVTALVVLSGDYVSPSWNFNVPYGRIIPVNDHSCWKLDWLCDMFPKSLSPCDSCADLGILGGFENLRCWSERHLWDQDVKNRHHFWLIYLLEIKLGRFSVKSIYPETNSRLYNKRYTSLTIYFMLSNGKETRIRNPCGVEGQWNPLQLVVVSPFIQY